VRGPRTAERLNLPAEKAICDSAVLLRALDLPDAGPPIDVAFMPHYESLERGFWKETCRLAGIKLIDPTHDPKDILSQLRGTRLLITEAMHGAIVADALRVPWISALPINPIHHAKWQDWASALSFEVRHHTLAPSSVLEAWIANTGGRGAPKGRVGRLGRSLLARPANNYLTHRAARSLQELARQEPQLSCDSKIEEVTERALAAVHGFVRNHSGHMPTAKRARAI
jgi:succinoglycan biosynthesis protein ExoV